MTDSDVNILDIPYHQDHLAIAKAIYQTHEQYLSKKERAEFHLQMSIAESLESIAAEMRGRQ